MRKTSFFNIKPSKIKDYIIAKTNMQKANCVRYVNDLNYSQNVLEQSPYFLAKWNQKLNQPLHARKLLTEIDHDLGILKNLPEPDWNLSAC